ncbi:sterol O-acyltransferase 1 isoform X1 [Vespula squamosa]|uniref:Sterol O-acyltransferase 1 isoform X1 n=1 Tax=Vespula squamosa TaxID=30214 RepID=A0ABD2B3K9_VESSQ
MVLFNIASALKGWDYGWIAGLVLYLLIFIVLPAKAIVDEGLPVASSTVILTEQDKEYSMEVCSLALPRSFVNNILHGFHMQTLLLSDVWKTWSGTYEKGRIICQYNQHIHAWNSFLPLWILLTGGIHHLIAFITGHGTSSCMIGFTPMYTKMWLRS